ncbi:MAG: Smr/MutS family protein [Spirochaetaceae bacterium]|jgi:DNA mismatch repair protein MutS2|nr:Smr/MutS family protein [Spirochaetaceae bacterium]
MNEKAVKLLEFPAIMQTVADYALSEEAAEILRNTKPAGDTNTAITLKLLVQQYYTLIKDDDSSPKKTLPVIHTIIPKLKVEGSTLELEEALALGLFIERSIEIFEWIESHAEARRRGVNFPAPPRLRVSSLSTEIFRIITRDGALRDLPCFRDIKRRISHTRQSIENLFAQYTNSDYTQMLQSTVPTQRDGRTVLAVKINFRGRIRGIVHEVSQTGQTCFIEPEEAVQLNNDIVVFQKELDAEIRRVLRELRAKLGAHYDEIKTLHEKTIELETIRARARWTKDTKAVFAEDAQTIQLHNAKHPLLKKPIPIDFIMNAETHAVIITGPNTGGKTVALKTLGLFAMMNQVGLGIPAKEGSSLPFFDNIFADIGDEQSIEQSLSTFSAHMANIALIMQQSTAQSLVLLDELGSGTDPQEGSSIAMAIMDSLLDKKASVIITTHHGALKHYAYTRAGVENACVDFDASTLSPTYRIVMGLPGESRALEIAQRNGLDTSTVNKAHDYLAGEQTDLSALIKELENKRRAFEKELTEQKTRESRLKEQGRKNDLWELRLKQKENELRKEGLSSFKKLLSEARSSLENLVRELKEKGGNIEREDTLRVKEFLRSLEAQTEAEEEKLSENPPLSLPRKGGGATGTSSSPPLAGGAGGGAAWGPELAPGIQVKIIPSGKRGRVMRLEKKATKKTPAQWLVEIGSVKMALPENELEAISDDAAQNPLATSSVQIASYDLSNDTKAQPELKLLGIREKEAIELLQKQIDAAVLQGLNYFAVVHGKGNGILQKAVHEYLKKDPRVADYYFSRPETGGFGRTEVVLKN